MIYAVITGTVVSGAKLSVIERGKLLRTITYSFYSLTRYVAEDTVTLPFEIYRGNGFQGVLASPEKALLVAVLIRLYLREKSAVRVQQAWDARIAIGVGTIERMGRIAAEGDGEAYQYSGPVLDGMKGDQRMNICTFDDAVNQELTVACALLDVIISRWSSLQAEVILHHLAGRTQQQIAGRLQVSQTAVHHRLRSAGWSAVEKCLHHYEARIQGLLALW